jgi:hypothetical protein
MDQERYARGKQVREAVLGAAHAARTGKNRTPFNAGPHFRATGNTGVSRDEVKEIPHAAIYCGVPAASGAG